MIGLTVVFFFRHNELYFVEFNYILYKLFKAIDPTDKEDYGDA